MNFKESHEYMIQTIYNGEHAEDKWPKRTPRKH